MARSVCVLALYAICALASAAEPRARDLGVPFEGKPGPLDAITDVAGVTVGQVTLIEDLADGHKVRTGVTAILPRGKASASSPVFAGWFALNGNGEMTGTAWIDESGQLEGPVMLTNTHSVGVVRDAVIAERVHAGGADASGYWWSLPVVAETWDGHLNDINGFHVKPEHVTLALATARGGPVEEGNVGGGTGMICHEFKCGIGTASRKIEIRDNAYLVGALVQANYGVRDPLRIAGVPVGQYLRNDRIYTDPKLIGDTGSIIVVVATDAPLLPHQLRRVAKRAGMGLARMGSYAGNGSGDIFIAFSTANAEPFKNGALGQVSYIGNDDLDALFEATVQATEEAIVNAMVAARDMKGEGGHYAKAIPHRDLVRLLKRFGRYRK
ncbi:DmpA family aminopeptidase [Dokdonella immobilis]|uniref:L-aminopeptidase DmpA. Serine peptidase. MEROPS family S58 n=1 Tax=Dokdonella immobilis TaxID=578942 RepID=A0A1I4X1D3_9GAMM|nr:P1 family peptidase [Dokdonella immobilis]SFN19811.1 L-aminopeptidase DmpA. Serine peptidase. MEROPS family S58 [Dokdonella immobilis]